MLGDVFLRDLLAAAEDFDEAREPGDDRRGEALECWQREKEERQNKKGQREIEMARAAEACTHHTTSFLSTARHHGHITMSLTALQPILASSPSFIP